ncbi:MAG TPA: M20 family metallopeptidase [Microthrixaceae bacterium]|nr:M20 family metallopeptidase [Microthrixaceae bacterium]
MTEAAERLRDDAKARAFDHVDRVAADLLDISHQIFDRPELCFEEHHAHDLLCDSLVGGGLTTTRHAFGLDTAFEAHAGSEGAVVAVVCEYDALPEIGHACGHNVIAAAGLGAALATAPLAQELGGQLRVLGTPAEEGGGGKEFMIRAGAFDDISAAMMIHPADHNLPSLTTLAFHGLEVDYHGVASHAAAAPHLGHNALDAAVLGYVNIAALRQHIKPDERIHGIFTRAGDKPNVVPKHTTAQWYVRSSNIEDLQRLKERVVACLQAGADASGCTMDLRWLDPPYAEMIDNVELLRRYEANARTLGRQFASSGEAEDVVGSTDMGNVSQVVPSIHPLIAVAPAGTSIHTADFAVHARGEAGDRAVIDGAKALAATVIDCWLDPLS